MNKEKFSSHLLLPPHVLLLLDYKKCDALNYLQLQFNTLPLERINPQRCVKNKVSKKKKLEKVLK